MLKSLTRRSIPCATSNADVMTPRTCADGTPLIGSVVSMKRLQPVVTVSTSLRINAAARANQISSLVVPSRAAKFLQTVTAGSRIVPHAAPTEPYY